MVNVGILDGQTIQALVFAKQLKKARYKVFLFCSSKLSYGFHTRYAKAKVICPSTQTEIKGFHKFLLDYLRHYKLDVVIPMNDYSAKYLSKNKLILKDKTAFSIPDYDIFMMGYDKNKLMKVCAKNNIPHPKSLDISLLKSGDVIKNFNFPALIKPNEASGARGITKVNSFKELWDDYDTIFKEYGDCHLQEFIPSGGKQYKAQILIKDNKVINSTVIEKLRYYPIKGGSSCFNRTIINNHIIEICEKVLKLINWEGFADFDLIEDPRDGDIKIMEINPRAPACIKASVISGVDFPKSIVEISLNKPITKYIYKPDKYLRYFSMDLLWLFSNKIKFKVLKEWTKKFFSAKHFLQDGELLDPLPFIVGTISNIVKLINPNFRLKKRGMN